mgnify:CR=1 FL=1
MSFESVKIGPTTRPSWIDSPPHVFCMCDWLQMIHPNALGITAKMVNLRTSRNQAYQQFICVAMRVDFVIAHSEPAIPTEFRCEPYPARPKVWAMKREWASLINLRPEPLC